MAQLSENGSSDKLFIAGIGVSAGSPDALLQTVAQLPEQASNLALVIVQQLHSNSSNQLIEVLQHKTSWKVQYAKDQQLIEAHNIYIVPPAHEPYFSHNTIHLNKKKKEPDVAPSINAFLTSLAEDAKQRAIGILISNIKNDGANGIEAIKRCGGYTIIVPAGHTSLPNAAKETDKDSNISYHHNIVTEIINFTKSFYERKNAGQTVENQQVMARNAEEEQFQFKQEQLSTIAANISDVIFRAVKGLDGTIRFTYISPSVEHLFEVSPDEVITDAHNLFNTVHPADQECLNQFIGLIKQYREQLYGEELRIITRKSGLTRWIRVSAKTELQPDGIIIGYGTLSDITSLKQFGQELKKTKEEAEKATKIKEEFLATMSHEIRTPLNAVIGLSNLLITKNRQRDLQENLLSLKFSSENLLHLINDILDFSKIEAGKLEVEDINFNLKTLINNIRESHQPGAQKNNNTFTIDIDNRLPEIVKGDQVRLLQVLNNLISNAMKFTKDGTVSLSLSLEKEDENHVWIRFLIKDTGIGISQSKLSHIFEMFSQADSSTVRQFGGTGLGLSITKKLLKLMDSEIHVESEEGKGSLFYFTIKLNRGMQDDMKEEDIGEQTDNLKDKQLKVLIVEDVDINRIILIQYLNTWWNFQLDEASNGQEAIDKAMQTDYDLILMDIRMPQVDGYTATRHIRKLNNHYQTTPIIALTADTLQEIELQQASEKVNFNDIITKPFAPNDLRSKIIRQLSDLANTGIPPSDQDPSISISSFSGVESQFKHHHDQLIQFYDVTIQSLRESLHAAIHALENRDYQAIKSVNHKSKTVLNLFGLSELQAVFEKIERIVIYGHDNQQKDSAEEKMLKNQARQLVDVYCRQIAERKQRVKNS